MRDHSGTPDAAGLSSDIVGDYRGMVVVEWLARYASDQDVLGSIPAQSLLSYVTRCSNMFGISDFRKLS